jgi:RNA polymerase sigma factor (sigma-70 family)
MGSYDELYRRHVDDARRVARIVTDHSDEADDVVSEAFTRVLDRLQRGGGPDEELTPYLRTVVRRLAVDRYRAARRDGTPADPTLLEVIPESDDPVARATDREMVRQAFDTLPDRWQRVLWHTEIEGRSPASLAASLGSTPNAVAALAYRAREGLRQAYLSVHLSSAVPEECKPYVPKLAAYVRGTLPPAEDRWVAAHLQQCAHCRERRDEVMVLVSDLRGVLWPALLGPVFLAGGGAAVVGAAASSGAAVLGAAGATSGAAVGAGAAASGAAGTIAAATGSIGGWFARIPRPKTVLGQLATTSASVAATAAIVTGALVVADDDSPEREDFAAAAPAASPEVPAATPARTASPTPTPLAPPVTVPSASPAEAAVGEEPVLEPTVEAVAPLPTPEPEPTIEPTTEPTPSPTAKSKSRRGPPLWLCQRMPWLRPCEIRFP